MPMISITAVNGENYQISDQIKRQIEEMSYDFPVWSSEELVECWCLLRQAVYSQVRKPSAFGIMNLYKPTLIKLSNYFEVESILSVMAGGGRIMNTPSGLYSLVMQELG